MRAADGRRTRSIRGPAVLGARSRAIRRLTAAEGAGGGRRGLRPRRVAGARAARARPRRRRRRGGARALARRRGDGRTRRFGTATVDGPRLADRRRDGAPRDAIPRPGRCPRSSRRASRRISRAAISQSTRSRSRCADGELLAVEHALEDLASGRLRVLHERSFLDDPTRAAAARALRRSGSASPSSRGPRRSRGRRGLADAQRRAPRRRTATRAGRARPGGRARRDRRQAADRGRPRARRARARARPARRRRAMLVLGAVARARRRGSSGLELTARERAWSLALRALRRRRRPRARARCGGRGAAPRSRRWRSPARAATATRRGAGSRSSATCAWQIGGDDLIAAGIGEGPEIGRAARAHAGRQARRRARRGTRRGAALRDGGPSAELRLRSRPGRWCSPSVATATCASARGAVGEPLAARAAARLAAPWCRRGGRAAAGARRACGGGRGAGAPATSWAWGEGDGVVDRTSGARRRRARRGLPADRGRAATAASRCSTAAGAAWPAASSPRACARCAPSASAGSSRRRSGPARAAAATRPAMSVREALRRIRGRAGTAARPQGGRGERSCAEAGVARYTRRRPVHDLRAGGPALLASARRAGDRSPGRVRVAALSAERGARQPRRRALAHRRAPPRARGATRATSRSSWPSSTSPPRTSRRWRRPASRWSARTAPRTCSRRRAGARPAALALHRRAAVAQGEADRASTSS